MSGSEDPSRTEVGHLVFRHAERPSDKCAYSVLPNDSFDMGRNEVRDTWQIDELTVSTHHLRFRCVMYDEDDSDVCVRPMVYARVLSSNFVRLVRNMGTGFGGELFTKTDGDVLLSHGDLLQLTPNISLLFQAKDASNTKAKGKVKGLSEIQRKELKYFNDRFSVSNRTLGSGGQASVFLAVKLRSGRQVACKVVPRPEKRYDLIEEIQNDMKLSEEQREEKFKRLERDLIHQRESLPREYNNLKGLDHPNIIRLEKVICASYNIYIFQELITGGDLISYMALKGALSEAQSVIISRQLLEAVKYLHDNGVVHRDIKPENILMTSWRDGARIVLTDFGQSRTAEDANRVARKNAAFRMHSMVGTHGYTAPEIYRQVNRDVQREGYSETVDMWSVGCIAALLLTNCVIFVDDDDEHKTYYKELTDDAFAQRWDLSIMDEGGVWADIGRKAKDFVRRCLVLDANQRPTAKEALTHHWFTNRHYATEIEAAYQRAIADWKPREQERNIIESINTSGAVLATTETELAKRYAEEVKSSYFESSLPPMPCSAFGRAQNSLPPSRHARTPIPAILEDAEVLVPRSPAARQSVRMSAAAVPLFKLREYAAGAANTTLRRLSIEDFAPPETQLRSIQRPSHPLKRINDGPAQSQLMLDDLAPTTLALRGIEAIATDERENATDFHDSANRYSVYGETRQVATAYSDPRKSMRLSLR